VDPRDDGVAVILLEARDESRLDGEDDVRVARRGVQICIEAQVMQDETLRLVLEVGHLTVTDGRDVAFAQRARPNAHVSSHYRPRWR
jgi:hypothetical protein